MGKSSTAFVTSGFYGTRCPLNIPGLTCKSPHDRPLDGQVSMRQAEADKRKSKLELKSSNLSIFLARVQSNELGRESIALDVCPQIPGFSFKFAVERFVRSTWNETPVRGA